MCLNKLNQKYQSYLKSGKIRTRNLLYHNPVHLLREINILKKKKMSFTKSQVKLLCSIYMIWN